MEWEFGTTLERQEWAEVEISWRTFSVLSFSIVVGTDLIFLVPTDVTEIWHFWSHLLLHSLRIHVCLSQPW